MKIAYILFGINSDKEKRIGLKSFQRDFLGKKLITAFSYILPDDESEENAIFHLPKKIQEQTGFIVTNDNVHNYGKVLMDDSSETYCLLFGVDVDMLREKKKESEKPEDLESTTIWYSLPEIINLEDWASILITTKRMAANNFNIHIKNL